MSGSSRSVALLLGGLLVGAAIGWGARQLSGDSAGRDDLLASLSARQDERLEAVTRLAEEDARAAQESALQQFYLLQAFRQVGFDGQAVVHVVDGRGDLDLAAASAGALSIPRLAADEVARDAWTESVTRLSTRGAQVDPGILDAFATVRAFVEAHPWPRGSGLTAAATSEWARPDVIESWLTANRALVSRVDGVLRGF